MPGEAAVITGYYRYTDIWFEWYLGISTIGRLWWTDRLLLGTNHYLNPTEVQSKQF